jgi:DNA-binding MarR family transcriptional regulator
MKRKTKQDLVHELVAATRASQVATDKMDDAGSRALGVNRTDGRCLDVIQQTGRISAGDLADRAGLTSGSVTAVIDRLEAKGFVRRVADPEDRRKVLLEVTDEMEHRALELWGPLAHRAIPHLGKLSVGEIELLIRYMRFATELNETRAAEIREELEG